MIKTILTWPNDNLRYCSVVVEHFNKSLEELRNDLVETCIANNGAGLAAIQIGVPVRALVVVNKGEPLFVVNPEVTKFSEQMSIVDEGCLSFPGVFEKVMRPIEVIVKFQTVTGEQKLAEFNFELAQAITHEIEHLDGVLLPDKLDSVKRTRFYKNYKIGRRRIR